MKQRWKAKYRQNEREDGSQGRGSTWKGNRQKKKHIWLAWNCTPLTFKHRYVFLYCFRGLAEVSQMGEGKGLCFLSVQTISLKDWHSAGGVEQRVWNAISRWHNHAPCFFFTTKWVPISTLQCLVHHIPLQHWSGGVKFLIIMLVNRGPGSLTMENTNV